MALSQYIVIACLCFGYAGYAQDRFSMDDFSTIEKIDNHVHIHAENTDFVAFAKRDRFSLLNIATQTGGVAVMEQKHRTVFHQ